MNTLFDMKSIQSPRRSPRVMAHVVDVAWSDRCLFECSRCGYDFEGEYFVQRSVTEDRAGRPCPICNADKSVAAAMKPAFIPLITKYYDAFASCDKDTEYRIFGPRWNYETCRVGRPVTLSKGYGKSHRLSGVIVSFRRVWWMDLPDDVRVSLGEIYDTPGFIACLKVKLR